DVIIHFAASVVVPDSVRDPLGYYRNNTVNSRALIESAVKEGVRHFIFSSTAAVYGNPERVPVREDDATVPTSPYGSSKLMTEIMLRDAGSAHGLRYVILRYFNVAGRPARPHRPVDQKRHPPRQVLGRNRARPAAKSGCLRHRLPDSGRHLHPRLHSRVRSRARALRCVGVSARRWRLRHAQLRLRPRFLRARGDRDGKASLGRRLRGGVRRPAGRGPGTDRGGFPPCPFFAQMAAAFRRPANHRASRTGMGAQAFDARRLTFANSSIPLEKRSHLAAIAFLASDDASFITGQGKRSAARTAANASGARYWPGSRPSACGLPTVE